MASNIILGAIACCRVQYYKFLIYNYQRHIYVIFNAKNVLQNAFHYACDDFTFLTSELVNRSHFLPYISDYALQAGGHVTWQVLLRGVVADVDRIKRKALLGGLR